MTQLRRSDQAQAFVRGFQSMLNNWLDKGFEPEVSALPILIPKGGVCMHIGASDGRHTYAMIEKAGASKVYAFEPSGYSYAMLQSTVWLHRFGSKVETFNLAVGATDGSLTLTTPKKINGNMGRAFAFVGGESSKRSDINWTGEKQQETVGVTSIDNFVAKHRVAQIDFIRADCEGAEMLVLAGAGKTIEKCWPSMLIEIHTVQLETLFNSSTKAVLDKLHRWGYRTFVRPSRQGPWEECLAPFQGRPWKDYACLHAERHKDRIAELLDLARTAR